MEHGRFTGRCSSGSYEMGQKEHGRFLGRWKSRTASPTTKGSGGLPPEPQPLRGFGRKGQTNWRRTALYDTRRAGARRKLVRSGDNWVSFWLFQGFVPRNLEGSRPPNPGPAA